MERDYREVLLQISALKVRVESLEKANVALAARVKTLEDSGGSADPTLHPKLDLLLMQVGALLMKESEALALLDQIDSTTNAMAADLTREAAAISEINLDIDALLTRAPGEPISDALKARFVQHQSTLNALAGNLGDKAAALEATAARTPVAETPPPPPPPPVEEPPVEQPPTEEPATPPV